MKFVRFDGGKTGLILDSNGMQVLDIAAGIDPLAKLDRATAAAIQNVLPGDGRGHWSDLIDQWDSVRDAFQTYIAAAEVGTDFGSSISNVDAVRLEAPLASPNVHIFAFSSNTAIHIQRAFKAMKNLDLSETEVLKPKLDGLPPGGFTLWPDTVVGPGGVVTPPQLTQKLDYEGECAVYVKRGGKNLDTVKIWGYTAWNDFGIRDTHLGLAKEGPWTPFSMNLVKNFDTGNACGPWVSVDEGREIERLRCIVRVNGEVRQDWNLGDMIYSFDEMLRYISTYVSLRPGDMLTSGTGAGVAIEGGLDGAHWLKAGDVVEVSLDGMGALINRIGKW